MLAKFHMYIFLYTVTTIIEIRGDYMNFEEKILYASRAKYGENQYIEDRLRKEIEVIKKKTSIEEVEFLLFLKENLDQNILIGNMPFLSLYLLGLSLINPLPATIIMKITRNLSLRKMQNMELI